METIDDLIRQRDEALVSARSIIDKLDDANRGKTDGDQRALTDDEHRQFDGFMAEHDDYNRRAELVRRENHSDAWREETLRHRGDLPPEERRLGTEMLVKLAMGDVRAVTMNLSDAYQVRELRRRGATLGEATAELAVRKAEVRAALPPEKRALEVGTTSEGGATVPTGFLMRLIDYREQYSGFLRMMPFVLPTADGSNMDIATVNSQGTAAVVAEEGTVAGTDPSFGTATLGAHKYGQLVLVSSELSEDNAVMLEEWLAMDMGRALGRAVDRDMVVGTSNIIGFLGASSDLGTATTEANRVILGGTGTGGAFTGDNLIDLEYLLDEGYCTENAYYFTKRRTVGVMRKLKDTQGNYLWQPSLIVGEPATFNGYRTATSPHVPAVAVDAWSLSFGNARDGAIVREARNIEVKRSEDFKFDTDQIAYRATTRMDMKIVDVNAFARFKGGTA